MLVNPTSALFTSWQLLLIFANAIPFEQHSLAIEMPTERVNGMENFR